MVEFLRVDMKLLYYFFNFMTVLFILTKFHKLIIKFPKINFFPGKCG